MWIKFRNVYMNLDTINMVKIKRVNKQYSQLKFFSQFKIYNFKIRSDAIRDIVNILETNNPIDLSGCVYTEKEEEDV